MSRVGKLPVAVPAGVTVGIDGRVVNVSGPKGKLAYTIGSSVDVSQADGKIVVAIKGDTKQARANFGTTRAIISNMVKGVTQGWKRSLELNGVGFTAKVAGKKLVLTVGFSHDVELEIPAEIKCAVNKNLIELESPDKQSIGTFAAIVRGTQPPEPYLGKGIKYSEEKVRRKAGKTGKK
jgi:large subunit ribosomal protein L6